MAHRQLKQLPTPADIRQVLQTCLDPELGIDIITLGLIYDVSVSVGRIHIIMTLTTPSCPLRPYFETHIPELLAASFPGLRTQLIVTFTPPWTPARMAPAGRALFGR